MQGAEVIVGIEKEVPMTRIDMTYRMLARLKEAMAHMLLPSLKVQNIPYCTCSHYSYMRVDAFNDGEPCGHCDNSRIK
jgi:hypothetical protein